MTVGSTTAILGQDEQRQAITHSRLRMKQLNCHQHTAIAPFSSTITSILAHCSLPHCHYARSLLTAITPAHCSLPLRPLIAYPASEPASAAAPDVLTCETGSADCCPHLCLQYAEHSWYLFAVFGHPFTGGCFTTAAAAAAVTFFSTAAAGVIEASIAPRSSS